MGSRGSLTKSAGPKTGVKKSLSNGSVDEVNKTPAPKKMMPARANGPATEAQRDVMAEYQRMTNDMTKQIAELKEMVEQVEKEREFYFGKLREIEILVQNHLDLGTTVPETERVFKDIQEIMYKVNTIIHSTLD